MHAPGLARAAAAVLALEGAALVVIALGEMLGLGSGQAAILTTGIALFVLTLIGAAALIAFAVGTLRGRSWARSGGVVLQILAIILAGAAMTLSPVNWPFVVGVGAPGVLGLILLLASARREAVQDER
ncbi:hypothetical protein ACWGJP_13845 [Microbacterium sp. NPDC055903]